MMNALERIEVYVRSVIAHEIGKISPLAYLDDSLINPKHLRGRPRGRCSARRSGLASTQMKYPKVERTL
jgi:abortive infection bacteriophage resistance protein